MPPRMHADEFEISGPLVRRLLDAQFPQYAHLPVARLEPGGTDHVVFRLGDELAVRFPRIDGATQRGPSREATWLPRLAPELPVEVPVPVAQGAPGHGYPWFWEIHTWVTGETLPAEAIDPASAADDLAGLIQALWRISPDGAPAGRGIPLAERTPDMRHWFDRFDGDPRAESAWALAAPAWTGPPRWHHGDLDARNWLVRDGRISGFIDWGLAGVGDPAVDLMVAWKLHTPAGPRLLRVRLPADEATWQRARGWVISQAVAILAYYTPETNPTLVHEAESWLGVALGEDSQ